MEKAISSTTSFNDAEWLNGPVESEKISEEDRETREGADVLECARLQIDQVEGDPFWCGLRRGRFGVW